MDEDALQACVALPRFYALEARAVAGLVVACEARRRPEGRSATPTTPKEPTCEPLLDHLPWEEPVFEEANAPEDAEPTFDVDDSFDDEPMGDLA